MPSNLAIFSAAILLSLGSLAQAQTDEHAPGFTLQVASFPDTLLAKEFTAKLARAGEQTVWGTIELPGRGYWTRVFVGSFKTAGAARGYGESLVRRGIIGEYLVKTAYDVRSFSRPGAASNGDIKAAISISSNSLPVTINPQRTFLTSDLKNYNLTALPVAAKVKLSLAPSLDTASIPRPDPVRLAFNFIVGSPAQRGGLWLTGDKKEGLDRLLWIVGSENADLISIDEDGRVKLNKKVLALAAGVSKANSPEAPLFVAGYINSNEGLLLLVQLTQGAHRYRLHIGRQAQTAGGLIEVTGSINLDNNYDSRINPYRRGGKKVDNERPPEGFDSLIAINPVARWFNLRTNSLVPVAHITFHELSEAHAKLEMRLDYLEHGSQTGAHNVALAREERLKSQRPASDVILTLGANRVLRSEEEIRQFYSQPNHAGGSKR